MSLMSTPSDPRALPERTGVALRVGWRVTMASSAMVWAWAVWSHRRSGLGKSACQAASTSWDTELAECGYEALSVDDAHRLAQEASRMQDA